jgi:phosphoribosylanthranilate isomerase
VSSEQLRTEPQLPIKINICGLFREQDIDYVNEARPDYVGFVFAESKRRVSAAFAAGLRRRLSGEIIPVGVFVNDHVEDIAVLYKENIISIAQLHGTEDDEYITRLKLASDSGRKKPIAVIKTISPLPTPHSRLPSFSADYYLIDSGAGSGKTFNWELLNSLRVEAINAKPWFLAGGVGLDNIEQALSFNSYALDISSGAETDGVKNREKIVQLVSTVRGYAVRKGK